MQVAKKALRKEPSLILWSVKSVEHLLQSIQQLTDPPLDLNTVMQRASLLRSSPACCVRMASWLRTNLQLSENELRQCLSRNPGVLARSVVGTSVTARAPCTLSRPVCCSSSFSVAVWHLDFDSSQYTAPGLKPCIPFFTRTPELDMVAGGRLQDGGGLH